MLQRLVKRSETSGRSDDNIEVIKKRFNTYQTETIPVIKEYEKDDRVVRVESAGSVEGIFGELEAAFKKRGAIWSKKQYFIKIKIWEDPESHSKSLLLVFIRWLRNAP